MPIRLGHLRTFHSGRPHYIIEVMIEHEWVDRLLLWDLHSVRGTEIIK